MLVLWDILEEVRRLRESVLEARLVENCKTRIGKSPDLEVFAQLVPNPIHRLLVPSQ